MVDDKKMNGKGQSLEYNLTVKSIFEKLKKIENYHSVVKHGIQIEDQGYLLCISELYLNDPVLISLLAKWREEAVTFHDSFKVTFEGTKKWLRSNLLDISDKILFQVANKYGHSIGHMGFANSVNEEYSMEVDNVIRGVASSDRGIMGKAMIVMLMWAKEQFNPKTFILRTYDDNIHAIQFYSKLGFIIEGSNETVEDEKKIKNPSEVKRKLVTMKMLSSKVDEYSKEIFK